MTCTEAANVKISVGLLFKLDTSFHSINPRHDNVAAWEVAGISFISLREQFDTSTALGRLLLNLLMALAEFEPGLEMHEGGQQRIKIGRPRVTDRRGFNWRFGDILERLNGEEISRRQAAQELGIGYATLKRLLDSGYQAGGPE